MKKKIAVLALMLTFATSLMVKPAEANRDTTGAVPFVLSWAFPGTGEWYNSGFKGEFPFLECCLGKICCLVTFSSMFDAVAGVENKKIRVDFWSAPKP